MTRKTTTITLIMLLASLATVSALAAPLVSFEAELGLHSKYVWRGMTANPDAVLQPAISGNAFGAGLSIWGNLDLTDIAGNQAKFSEIDYTLTYNLAVPMFSVTGGLIHYTFPGTGGGASTTEVFAQGTADVVLSPTVAIYYDFDEIDGMYIEAGVGHGIPAGPVNVELGAVLGYGSADYVAGYFGAGTGGTAPGSGPTDLRLSAGVPWQGLPFLTITPAVTYATLLGDAKDSGAWKKDAVVFGVTASASF